jgi:hypothetical protein
MKPITNPFAPGAGTPPPELVVRDELLETIHIAPERTRLGYLAKSVFMVGLRGVGKPALLDWMRDNAEEAGLRTLRIDAPEKRCPINYDDAQVFFYIGRSQQHDDSIVGC